MEETATHQEAVDRPHHPLRGLRVVILSSGHDALDGRIYDKEACSFAHLGAEVSVVAAHATGKNGPVMVHPVKTPASRWERFLVQPWRCFWCARHLHPDIVHFHDAELLTILPVARLVWPQARFVYDVHEDFGNLLLVRDWIPSGLRAVIAAATDIVEKSLTRLAHGVVGVTPPLTENFPHMERTTAYNFPSRRFYDRAAHFARPPREREYDLVHLGTLSMRRAGFLVEVLCNLHAMRPGTRTLIFGCSPQIQSYLQERVPPGCTVQRSVPYDEVARILGNARVGIDLHPWLGPHLRLAFAVKVSEYMASGCAVVASWMPVLEDVLVSARMDPSLLRIVKGDSASQFASEICTLLQRIDRGDDPGEALRVAAVETLIWEGEANKIGSLYLRLLKKNPSVGHSNTPHPRQEDGHAT